MHEKFYTSTDAAQITGCTPRQLQYWRQKGVVVPTVNTIGTGRNVYYSVADLLELTVMNYLLKIGLEFEVCQQTLKLLQYKEPNLINVLLENEDKKLMLWQPIHNQKVELEDFDEEKASAAIRSGRAVIPFWTSLIRQQLEERLMRFTDGHKIQKANV